MNKGSAPGGPRTPEQLGHIWAFHKRLRSPIDKSHFVPKSWIVVMGMCARDTREETLYVRCGGGKTDASWWTEL